VRSEGSLRGGRHHNTGVKEVRTTPIRLMGLSLVLLGAVGVVWLTSSPGANTMAKADESGKPRRSELRKRLSSLQYYVTQEDGTEPAFQNQYMEQSRRRHLR